MKSGGMNHLYVTAPMDKLNEAKYFLARMREMSDDWDAFRFNLSAFLAAARNVTWIMHKQYAHFSEFSSWFDKKQKEMSESKLMRYFKKQRNQVTKERTITSSLPVQIYPANDPSKILSMCFIDGTGGTAQPIMLDVIPRQPGSLYYFSDFTDKDVISLCQDYLDEVEKVVSDWESRFQSR